MALTSATAKGWLPVVSSIQEGLKAESECRILQTPGLPFVGWGGHGSLVKQMLF